MNLPCFPFLASKSISMQSPSLLGGKPFAWFLPSFWQREGPGVAFDSMFRFYKASCIFFFLQLNFLTTSWWLINISWVTQAKVYDVERPETPHDLWKIITDNVVTLGFIAWYIKKKVGDCSRVWPEGSLFNSYNTKVQGRALLHSLDFSTLPLIFTLECWVLSKAASSTMFLVFGMLRPRIEPRSSGLLANTLLIRPMTPFFDIYIYIYIYILSSTDCFVVSQLFSMAREVGRLKVGSKPAQLYVRLGIIPLCQ